MFHFIKSDPDRGAKAICTNKEHETSLSLVKRVAPLSNYENCYALLSPSYIDFDSQDQEIY